MTKEQDSGVRVKVYLAARYSRAAQLREARADLLAEGYEVTSRWIDGGHELTKEGSTEAHQSERTRFAVEDMSDCMAADWVISFTEEPRKTTTRGGRHVEFGMALAAGKRVTVIGYRENVFHCLPQVEFFESWAHFRKVLPNALDLSAIVPPPDEVVAWRCFHCDEVFTDEAAARLHFGESEVQDPLCAVTAERYREVERRLDTFITESDPSSRAFYALGAEHYQKERDAEQKGYDRGLADAKAHPEILGLTAPSLRNAVERLRKVFDQRPAGAGAIYARDLEAEISAVEAALAPVEATPSAGEWHDISTAPKDGTWFLGWNGRERDVWRWDKDQPTDTDLGYWVNQADSNFDDVPLLWQPLPEPPHAA